MSCKNSDNEIKKIILSIANSTISVTDITDNMNLMCTLRRLLAARHVN